MPLLFPCRAKPKLRFANLRNFDQNFQEEIPLNVRPGQGSRDALDPRGKFPFGLTMFPFRGRRKQMQNKKWQFLIVVGVVAVLATVAFAQSTRTPGAQRAGMHTYTAPSADAVAQRGTVIIPKSSI